MYSIVSVSSKMLCTCLIMFIPFAVAALVDRSVDYHHPTLLLYPRIGPFLFPSGFSHRVLITLTAEAKLHRLSSAFVSSAGLVFSRLTVLRFLPFLNTNNSDSKMSRLPIGCPVRRSQAPSCHQDTLVTSYSP